MRACLRLLLFVCGPLLAMLLCCAPPRALAQPPKRWSGGGKARRRRTSMVDMYGRPRLVNGRNPVDPRLPRYTFDRDANLPFPPYAQIGALREYDDHRFGLGWSNVAGRYLML
jgi:hypothetical protein